MPTLFGFKHTSLDGHEFFRAVLRVALFCYTKCEAYRGQVLHRNRHYHSPMATHRRIRCILTSQIGQTDKYRHARNAPIREFVAPQETIFSTIKMYVIVSECASLRITQ